MTYHWIKEQLEREAKEQGKDLRWVAGAWGSNSLLGAQAFCCAWHAAP